MRRISTTLRPSRLSAAKLIQLALNWAIGSGMGVFLRFIISRLQGD
jgi:hypothetical protein